METKFTTLDFVIFSTIITIVIGGLIYVYIRNRLRRKSSRADQNAFFELNRKRLIAIGALQAKLEMVSTDIKIKDVYSYDIASKMYGDCYAQWKRQYSNLFTVVLTDVIVTQMGSGVFLYELPPELYLYQTNFSSIIGLGGSRDIWTNYDR